MAVSLMDTSSSIFSISHRTRPLLWILISSSSVESGRVALQEVWDLVSGRRRGGGPFPIGSRGVGVLLVRDGKGCFSSCGERWEGAFPMRGGGPTGGGSQVGENGKKKKKGWTRWFGGNHPVYLVRRSNHWFNWPNSDLNTFQLKWPDRIGTVTDPLVWSRF